MGLFCGGGQAQIDSLKKNKKLSFSYFLNVKTQAKQEDSIFDNNMRNGNFRCRNEYQKYNQMSLFFKRKLLEIPPAQRF